MFANWSCCVPSNPAAIRNTKTATERTPSTRPSPSLVIRRPGHVREMSRLHGGAGAASPRKAISTTKVKATTSPAPVR